MRMAWIAALAAGCLAGAAIAEPPAPQKAPPAEPGTALPGASRAPAERATGAARDRTGEARNGRTTAGKAPRKTTAAQDALTSCIAMWDRRTHMTRRQWARACRRVADRLKGETLR